MVTKAEAIEALEAIMRQDASIKNAVEEYLNIFCDAKSIQELDDDDFDELVDLVIDKARKKGDDIM